MVEVRTDAWGQHCGIAGKAAADCDNCTQVHVPSVPLLIHLPANNILAKDDASDWALPLTWETRLKLLDPGFSLHHPWAL